MRFLLTFLALITIAFGEEVASISSLIPEVKTIAPGKPFTVAMKLEHPKDWHSYYKNSGGVEQSPEITWKLPEGATAGEIQWPVPTVKDAYGEKSFIYKGSPVFLIEITPPASLKAGDTFTFTADAVWQICETQCITENAKFSLNLAVADAAEIDATHTTLFSDARAGLPKALSSEGIVTAKPSEAHPDLIELHLPKEADNFTDFIPDQPYIRAYSDKGAKGFSDDGFSLLLKRKKIDFIDNPITQGNTISGILTGPNPIIINETQIDSPASIQESVSFGKLLPILGGMLIGGLILNLMPCVFPVIGLKIMGFVQQAGHDRKSIAMHGVSFALGVMASFAVLSGILFAVRAAALRSGGDTIGWGYQLQNPWVVLVLLLLMFILALNMFGLFEMGTAATSVGGNLQNKSGHAGSFFSGVLATVVATPCSAPFLGAAIGATMALPAIQFFSGFAAMALGLALPYLILSIFPHLVEKLPRPGAWMESFKQAMSFLLFATAAYLVWVYSGLIGQDYLLAPLLGLSLIAAAAWVYGRWNLPHKPGRTRFIAMAITAAFALSGIVLALPPKPNKLWEPWSQATEEQSIADGKTVYIDFTAQWCLTCQVNKKVAYTEDVRALAKKKGIVFLKADKTRANPEIEARLQELGRSAIPTNVLLVPGKDPVVAPEVLTPSILTELFNTVP